MITKRGFETFLVSILLVGTFFGGVVYGNNLANPTVCIDPPAQVAAPGESNVCVQVLVNSDGTPVMGIRVKLTYPTDLDLTSFDSNKLLGSSALEVGIPDTSADTGMIDYSQALPYGVTPIAINGNLATLCFTVSNTPGIYTLDITEVTLIDASGNTITGIVVTDGTITVTNTQVNISPSVQQVNPEDPFVVNITIDPMEPIAGAQMDLCFDPSILTCNSVANGGMFDMWINSALEINNINGVISNIMAFDMGDVTSPGTFAIISFTAKDNPGISPVSLSNAIVGNPSGEPVPITLNNGVVLVGEDMLFKGWNMVTVPVENTWTAETLGENISGCEVVTMFNATTQTFLTHVVGVPHDDFPILDGVGYFVYVANYSIFNISGSTILTVDVTIEEEWNIIGWYHELPTTAEALGQAINGTSVVSMFDPLTQTFLTHVVGIPHDNFSITQGMGLFIYTNESSFWHGEGGIDYLVSFGTTFVFFPENTSVTLLYEPWDVNMDGQVNVLDAILILQHLGETGFPGWIVSDVNCDGMINILDLILVGQHWTG